MKRDGFTLIEMLISMVLMIILSIAMYGYWSKNYQDRQKILCQKNLQTIYMALHIYAEENHQSYPYANQAPTAEVPLSLLVPRYSAATDIFICPGSRDSKLPEAQSFAKRRISYAYYMGRTASATGEQPLLSDRQVDTGPKIKDQLLFSPDGKKPGNNHYKYGGCFLFGDGHAEDSPVHAAHDLPVSTGLVLLNPQP